ncbi:hypothetical protein DXM25_22980 [Agrobacterium rosae]|nr:hypothetical protein DXM25_22980 [Agrobacterium rosae]MQB50964.1 hypothetical protein [Agrobacterium rosae]
MLVWNWCTDQISTFFIYAAGIETRLIGPACRTNINATRRHHIGKMKFKVTNWVEYEAGLRRCGSMTLWISLITCSAGEFGGSNFVSSSLPLM